MGAHTWSEADRIYALSMKGTLSASEIADVLGCSRNAVIGVWFRGRQMQEQNSQSGGAEMKNAPIRVEKNIPIPARKSRPCVYPWDTMTIGDSFFVAGKSLATINHLCQKRRKDRGEKYTIRTIDGGIRVWRVA